MKHYNQEEHETRPSVSIKTTFAGLDEHTQHNYTPQLKSKKSFP